MEYERFAAVRNISSLDITNDGKWLLYTINTSGQLNLWKQRIIIEDKDDFIPPAPVQLTDIMEGAVRSVNVSPDNKTAVVSIDTLGNEMMQIYRVPIDEGWHYPLIRDPSHRFIPGIKPFSKDGKYLAYSSDIKNPYFLSVFIYDFWRGESKCVMSGEHTYMPVLFSEDGRFLVVSQINLNIDNDLFIVDIESGENRRLTPHREDFAIFLPVAFVNSETLLLITNYNSEFAGLYTMNLNTCQLTPLLKLEHDIEHACYVKKRETVFLTVNEGGYSRLFSYDMRRGKLLTHRIVGDVVCYQMAVSENGDVVGLLLASSVSPTSIYVFNPEKSIIRRMTQTYLGGIPEEKMIRPLRVSYKTHDGLKIEGWLYIPEVVPAGGAPCVLSIHGGPEAQERPNYAYNGFYQYLLSRGIAVFAPNIRGSTGYGKSFQKLIYRKWGTDDILDIYHAYLFLSSHPSINRDKIGIFGGSYGGFAVLSAITQFPEIWRVAVDIFGPSNLITFCRSVPPFWKPFIKIMVGDPEEDAEMLSVRSPINYIEKIQCPLLIIHGANDPRVVKSESDQIVEKLRSYGKTVEYMVFEDEGHGFTKPANYLKALKASAEFLIKYLS